MRRSTPHTARRLALVAAFACAVALPVLGGCARANVSPTLNVPDSAIMPSETPTPTVPLAGKVEAPASGAYLGVYVPPAPYKIETVDAFTRLVGRNVSIVMWYQPWSTNNRSEFDPGACIAVMRRGKVPMITWEPWDPGANANDLLDPSAQPDFKLQTILDGTYDDYIRGWAQEIRAIGGPVMLRPMHEMNGYWYPWAGNANGNSPKLYIAAWRHIHDIFQAEGATNVTWVWSINNKTLPPSSETTYGDFYPGDEYVDWTAISGFNWGTSKPTGTWESFSHAYDQPIAYLTTLGKPIAIAEFGSVEQGGDKAAWIADAYRRIATFSKVSAVIYFDSLEKGARTQQDWRVNTTPASLEAFRAAVASSYFVDSPPAALTTWGDSLPKDTWQYLSTLLPTY